MDGGRDGETDVKVFLFFKNEEIDITEDLSILEDDLEI